jgi:hypothetical protein
MAKNKPTPPDLGPAPIERVQLRHGFVALMFEEVQPGTVETPAPPPLEKPKYKP